MPRAWNSTLPARREKPRRAARAPLAGGKLTYRPERRTKAEKAHHDAVAAMGCLICQASAEIHHLKHDPFTGEHLTRRDHRFVIPLCPLHHRQGGWGVAYHAGSRYWQFIHGTEAELWNRIPFSIVDGEK